MTILPSPWPVAPADSPVDGGASSTPRKIMVKDAMLLSSNNGEAPSATSDNALDRMGRQKIDGEEDTASCTPSS